GDSERFGIVPGAPMDCQVGSRCIGEARDGRTISVAYQPMPNGGWVVTHEDVTERKQSEARIAHLALHDPLTDLPNRAAFNEHLAYTFGNVSAGQPGLAILCIHLDRFKG